MPEQSGTRFDFTKGISAVVDPALMREGFAAWTQAKPAQVRVDGAPVAFTWTDGLLEASVESDAACEVLIGF